MYSALIIDDEEPARKAIKALGAWEEHGITRLYEAENGKQGLELLELHRPELVFVDMKMPLLGGVEFLRKAQGLTSAKCIVISGFDDFQYARSAIQSGAMDYLLKPIKKKELNDVLRKAAELLEQERAQQHRKLLSGIVHNISVPLVKEKIFASIIDHNGKFHRIKELEALIDAKAGECFVVIVVTVLNFEDVCRNKFAGDTHACYFAISNALNELLGGSIRSAFSFKSGKDPQEMVAVLSSPRGLDRKEDKTMIARALQRLQETFAIDCLAAYKEQACSLEQMDEAYQAAKSMLLSADTIAPLPVHTVPSSAELSHDSILASKALMVNALETGSTPYAVGLVRNYMEQIRQTGYFPAEAMVRTVVEFRILLEQIAKELSVPAFGWQVGYDVLFAHSVMRFDDFADKTAAYLERWAQMIAQLRKPQEKFSIEKIKDYIDNRFYEDISIAHFTEMHFVSKEHLLRLFKHKYGCGIYEYTLNVRMEKAKELLTDPTIKIQTVCEKVGYRDHNYFSKAFKKHCGVSPLEYRMKLQS